MPIQHSDIPEVNPEDPYGSIQCSEDEVYNLLCSLDTSKSNGDDDISAVMLRNTALSITEAVTKSSIYQSPLVNSLMSGRCHVLFLYQKMESAQTLPTIDQYLYCQPAGKTHGTTTY